MLAARRRTRRRLTRLAACAVASIGALAALPAAPASAEATTTDPFGDSIFTDVSLGNTADDVGDIWIKRTVNDAGDGEVLLVSVSVIEPGEISESSVCVEDEAFTDRDLGVGGCDGVFVQQGDTGSSALYEVDLGTDFAGEALFAQIHVTLTNGVLGGTAFGGWLPGNPFYGSNEVEPETCPEGMEHTDDGDGIVEEGECTPPPYVCDGETDPASDVNEDGTIDADDCEDPEPPYVCDGETDPASDVNEDGTIDADDCAEPEVVTCPVGMVHDDANEDGIVDAGECELPAVVQDVVITNTPSTPATPASTPTVLAAAAAAPTQQVLGATLARTGADTADLLPMSFLLLALGGALVAESKRRSA
ncbi:MAG: hypothetical protein ACRDYW_09090 [Acidimicrobiales bacterium]